MASTILAGEAGVVPNTSSYADKPVNDLLVTATASLGSQLAVTAYHKDATRYDVYFNVDEFIDVRTVIHEGLHSLFRVGDGELATKLGRDNSEALSGSAWINDRLNKWGCN